MTDTDGAVSETNRGVSADGTEIVGRVHGQGPPLVLLHGRLEDGDSCWGPMLALLTDRFTCLTPSTRGRGLSGDNPDHAPQRLVEDAVAFIDSIGEPVAVFGWSSGAALALAALARSTMAAAAAIYEPSVSEVITEQEGTRLRSAVAGMAEMAGEGRPAEAARAFVAVVATDHELATALAAGYEDTWAPYVPGALQEFGQTHLSPAAAPRPTDPSLLAQISTPVLVLHGSQTPLQSLTDGVDHVARHVPDARVREIPGVGHLAPIAQPTPIAEELIRFFHPAAAEPPEPPANPRPQRTHWPPSAWQGPSLYAERTHAAIPLPVATSTTALHPAKPYSSAALAG